MKSINSKATALFAALLARMDGQYLKISNEPFMPLTVELIGQGINTELGIADQYSLCHYFEQNGDLMQDPEMRFLVIDKREQAQADYSLLTIIPCMFQNACTGLYQESLTVAPDGTFSVKVDQQAAHANFASQWLKNLYHQGFINP